MSLKLYSKAHKKIVSVTAMMDSSKVTYGKASDTTLKYKVGSGAPAAYKGHTGLDTAGGDGSPIYSIYDGTVRVNTYEKNGAGYYASIGTDMNGKNYRLMYMHLKKKSTLKVGAKVKAGDLIGYQGSTGHSTGSHLHISVKVADKATSSSSKFADPFDYVMENEKVNEKNADFSFTSFETGVWRTKSAMNIRSGAGTTFEKVGSIPKDTALDVIGVTSNGWGKIAPDQWFCLGDESEQYAERIGDSDNSNLSALENKLKAIIEIAGELNEALK